MSQIFDRVFLCKILSKDDYLQKHGEIVSSVLSSASTPFKQLSDKDYLDAHKIVVEHIVKTGYSNKNESDYFIEHEKIIRDLSSKDILKYPVDLYLDAHRKIVELIKQSFSDLVLLFNLSNDKYLCVIGEMEKVVKIPSSDYKLLFKPLNKNEYFEKHKDLVFKVRKVVGEEAANISLGLINRFSIIREIISRVEKRKVYFHLFHKGLEMGELNESALYCFWILKLHPFKHKTSFDDSANKWDTDKVNLLIALHLFLGAARLTIKELHKQGKLTSDKFEPSESFLRNLAYSFKYHDLSKEAIMTLAASLVV